LNGELCDAQSGMIREILAEREEEDEEIKEHTRKVFLFRLQIGQQTFLLSRDTHSVKKVNCLRCLFCCANLCAHFFLEGDNDS
jgi:hypothetical protein